MPTILTAMSMPSPYFSGIATNRSSRNEMPSQKATMRNRPTGVAADTGIPRLIVGFYPRCRIHSASPVIELLQQRLQLALARQGFQPPPAGPPPEPLQAEQHADHDNRVE